MEAQHDDDRERNRLCPPNTLPDTTQSWARMQVRGVLATRVFGAEPDIAEWANGCALNPQQTGPRRSRRDDPAVLATATRLQVHADAGLRRLARLAGEPPAGEESSTGAAESDRARAVTSLRSAG